MGAAAAPTSEPVDPGSSHPAVHQEKSGVGLPRMWLGFALAVMSLIAEIFGIFGDLPPAAVITARMLIGFSAWCYWLFCVYRIHKVLVRATHGSYQIKPFRAIWPQFIPVYCWVWAVQWPNRLGKFLKSQRPDLKMKLRLPGILLLLASVIGIVGPTSIRLLVVFGVGTYLNRRISEVIAISKPTKAERNEFDLALSAGLGAGFGAVFCQAVQGFSGKKPREQVQDVLVILLVTVGIAKFIEPLADRVRHAFHATHNSEEAKKKSFWLRVVILIAIVFSGFSHELLHAEIAQDPWGALRLVAAMLILSGGITYAWAASARKREKSASLFGFISGGGLSSLLVLALFIAFNQPVEAYNSQSPAGSGLCSSVGLLIPWSSNPCVHLSSAAPEVIPGIIAFHVSSMMTMAAPLVLWSLLGLAGGLVIDRTRGAPWLVAAIVFLTALIVSLSLRFADAVDRNQIILGASAVTGWCVSLWIYPEGEKLLTKPKAERAEGF
jgi:hypothetical protein